MLHNQIKARAVLDAYVGTDLRHTAESLLDNEEDENDDEDTSKSRQKKKPWRCRWPDDFRDEVLARLLDLNKQRAEQERLTGLAAEGKAGGKGKTRSKKGAKSEDQPGLF